MRLRIIEVEFLLIDLPAQFIINFAYQLEDELAGQPPAKKSRTSKAAAKDGEATQPAAPGASTSAPSTSLAKPSAQEAKKTEALIKKMWTRSEVSRAFIVNIRTHVCRFRLQKEIKTDAYKFRHDCKPKTIRFEEVIEESEFKRIFVLCNPRGRIVQPRADNKPNSTVWIVEYVR